jgi:hypothetical protein
MSLAVDNGFSNLLFRFDYINCGVVREIDSQWNIDVEKLVLLEYPVMTRRSYGSRQSIAMFTVFVLPLAQTAPHYPKQIVLLKGINPWRQCFTM